MAQQEGIAAALQLDDKILNDLKAAQERITAMKNAADGLEKSFQSIGKSAAEMARGLKGTGISFESAFDSSGALKSIKLISEAVTNVGKKGSAVKQQFDFSAEIDKTRQKISELQNLKAGMDRRDIGFTHAEYASTASEIESLKAKLGSLLEARHKAFSGKPEKRAQGEFKEYIAGLTRTNDGLKKMNAYYRELEKSSTRAAKEQEKVFAAQQRAQGIQDRAVGILGVSPNNVSQMLEKLRQLEAVKRELETEQKKTGILDPALLQQVNTQIARTGVGIRHINSRLKETSTSANLVRSMLATAFSPFLVQRFIGEMVKVRGEFELSQKSLAVIIGDATKAQAMFNDITQIAVRSPFSVQDLLKQTKQLAAYRIETDKLIDTTKMLGDISAGVGVDMNRLILAYGQVKAAEFLKGTELRQFSEAGVNMLGGLAKRFTEIYGRVVSVGEVMQMVSKRMVKFADVEAVLKEATEAGGAFYKMQEKQAETIQGRISNLQDRIQIMFNNVGKGYDGLIKGIITGLENVISHWQALSAILEPMVVLMLVKGTAGLLGFTKVGREIREAVEGLRVPLEDAQGKLKNIQKISTGIQGTFKGIGNFLKANWISILIYAAAVVADLVIKATQFRREVRKIANEASASVNEQVMRYERLLDIAADTNKEEKDRQKALDALKSEYGNILDIQKIELSNIENMNSARAQQIELIQKQAYEEARAKAVNAAIENAQSSAGKQAESLNKMVRFYQYLPEQMKDIANFIDRDDMDVVQRKVAQAILEGTIDGEEAAGREVIKMVATIAGKSKEQIEELLASVDGGYIKSIGSIFSSTLDDMRKIDAEISRVPGEVFAKAMKPYQELIKTIGNAREEFNKTANKPEYEFNPALREQDFLEYVQGVKETIKKEIEDGFSKGDLAQHMVDQLNEQLEQAFNQVANIGSNVEQAIRRAQIEVAAKYGKVGQTVIGDGLLKYEEGQSAIDYIKNIQTTLDEAIKVAEEWDQLMEQVASGHTSMMAPRILEILNTYGSKEELLQAIGAMKELILKVGGTPKKSGGFGGNSQKQNLNAFITALRNASKELDNLPKGGADKYIEKLAYLGKRAGIALDESFTGTNEQILALIEKYKNKLEENDRIDIELNLITDTAEEKLDAYSRLVKDLWDRYDNSKKLEEWGLMPQEGTTGEVMAEIKELESYLRNSGLGDKATEMADDAAQRIREIFRSEQEEAAKAIYDANKKSLDKTGQAYQAMMEQLEKIDKWSDPQEKAEAKANQIMKSMREIADAQWDAFKGSEAYALAFGDLSGLSDDLLASLKKNLQTWLQMGDALNPTEMIAVQKQIRKIDEAMDNGKARTYFGAIAMGLREIGKAREIGDKLPELSQAVADAEEKYMEALKAENAERAKADNSPEGTYRLAKATEETAEAEENLRTATQNLNNAQSDYNRNLNNSVQRMQDIESAYQSIGKVITDSIGLVVDFADAFGLPVSDESRAAIEGFEQGFQLVGQAITLATSAMAAYKLMTELTTKTGKTLLATMAPFIGPLLVAFAGIGTALAVFKAKDVSLQKQIEQHKENVEKLEKAYKRLEEAMDKALDLSSARQSYAEMNANLAKQRQELNEAIAANDQRKQTDKVKEETEELKEQLKGVADQMEDTRDKWLEMLGAPTDYQSVAKDWAGDWLSAFKETGSGLDALKDDFDELYDDLVAGQIWSQIMGPRIKELQGLIESSLADGRLEDTEAAAIRQYRSVFGQLNDQAADLAKQLGITPGSAGGSTLQRGVETVTEKTAEALESILNSTRYDVSDTNARVANIESILNGSGENTIMSQLRSQTRYLADIAKIASAVYAPGGHYKGGNGGIKVFAEIK